MLFSQHDFFINFEGINNSKDTTLMKELLFFEIAKLIALHKKELLTKIKDLGYKLPDTKDATLVDFIFERAGKDQKVADVIAEMIKKYNIESSSSADASEVDWGGVAAGLGATISGVFNYVSTAKQSKAAVSIAELQKQQAKEQNDMLLQIEAIKAQNPSKGLGTGAYIAIGVVVLALITGVVILALRKPKVVVAQTEAV